LSYGCLYPHAHGAIAIEGDILSAAVAGDRLVKIRVCWHKIVDQNDLQKMMVVDVEQSLAAAAESLVEKFGNTRNLVFKLRQARLCYYGFHDAGKASKLFLPAWHFRFEKDGRLYHKYVNAHTSEAINFELDIANAHRKEKE